MASDGFWSATTGVGGSEDKRTGFGQDCLKRGIVRDADTDSGEMVVVKVVEIGIFGEDESQLAGDVLVYDGLGQGRDEDVILDSCWTFGDKGENFARAKIAVFNTH